MTQPETQRVNKRAAMEGFSWSLFYNLINKVVLPLANAVFIARVLGPHVMGVYALLYGFFIASEIFRDAGLSLTYMRDPDVAGKKEGSYMALGTLQGLLPAIVLFAVREPLAAFYRSPELVAAIPWISLGLLINGFGTIPRAKILRAGRIKESGFREMIANVIALAVAIVLVWQGFGFAALVVQLVLNCLLNVAISYSLAPVTSFRFDWKQMGVTFRAAASTMGASLLFNLYQLADTFVIGRVVGLAGAGLYSQGKNLAQKPLQLVTMPMMRPLQVAFSQNAMDAGRIGEILVRSLKAAIVFVIPLFGVVAIAAEPITLLLLGPDWRGAIPVVRICCLYFAARTLGTIANSALVAGGKARLTLISWIVGYMVVPWGVIVAAQLRSLEAMALAFSLGAALVFGLQTVLAFRSFPTERASLGPLLRVGTAAAVTSGALGLVFLLQIEPWAKFGLALAIGGVVHLVAVGVALGSGPVSFVTPAGMKRLYRSL